MYLLILVCLLFSDIREKPACCSIPCRAQYNSLNMFWAIVLGEMSVQPELTECILVEQLLFHTVLALYSSVLLLVWSQINW